MAACQAGHSKVQIRIDIHERSLQRMLKNESFPDSDLIWNDGLEMLQWELDRLYPKAVDCVELKRKIKRTCKRRRVSPIRRLSPSPFRRFSPAWLSPDRGRSSVGRFSSAWLSSDGGRSPVRRARPFSPTRSYIDTSDSDVQDEQFLLITLTLWDKAGPRTKELQ